MLMSIKSLRFVIPLLLSCSLVAQQSYLVEIPTDKSTSFRLGQRVKVDYPINREHGLYRITDYGDFARELARRGTPTAQGYELNGVHIRPDRPIELRNEVRPNDPDYAQQTALERIGAPEAWQYTTGGLTDDGTEIVIGVIDSGTDTNHEDLVENLWINPDEIPDNGIDDDGNGFIDDVTGWNFINNTPEQVLDNNGHGSKVAGVLGARGDNGLHLAGVNWRVKIIPFDANSEGSVTAAGYYLRDLRRRWNESGGTDGAFVVAANFSLGISANCNGSIWGQMMEDLGQEGILSVGATVNAGDDIDEVGDIPSGCATDFLLSVSVTNEAGEFIRRANGDARFGFGAENIDLVAPGRELIVLDHFDRTTEDGGTSFATPYVTGAIGLLYSVPCTGLTARALADPAATALEVRDAILGSVEELSEWAGRSTTGGILSLPGAMERMHGYCLATTRSEGFIDRFTQEFDLLKIYPNPASEQITIEYGTEDFQDITFEVYDAMGRFMTLEHVTTEPFVRQSLNLELWKYPNGVYFVTVRGTEEARTLRFVVSRE